MARKFERLLIARELLFSNCLRPRLSSFELVYGATTHHNNQPVTSAISAILLYGAVLV